MGLEAAFWRVQTSKESSTRPGGQALGSSDGVSKMNKGNAGSTGERRGRRAAKMSDLSTVGLVFPVAMVIGYLGGRVIGSWLGAAEAGGLVGGGVGLVSGFYNVYKTALELDAKPAPSAEREEQDDES